MSGMAPAVARPRLFACLVTVSTAAAALSLSDRAPSLVQGGLGSSRQFYHRVEGRAGVELLHRSDIPLAWETAGHLALWAVITALATLVVGRRRSLLAIVGAAVVVSTGVEVAQVLFSATRQAEWGDVVANAVGAMLGATAARTLDHATAGFGRTVAWVRSAGTTTP